jgi:hypothetical protein
VALKSESVIEESGVAQQLMASALGGGKMSKA